MNRFSLSIATAIVGLSALGAATALESTWKIDISPTDWELAPGLKTPAWTYGGAVPGIPIVAKPGELLRIEVTNKLAVPTNIHWHGLVVPNDQDGPAIVIQPGATFVYSFTPRETGTYWYHPHFRPVLDQLDRGLYAPLIVLAPEDSSYSGDRTFVLDDWYLDARGKRLPGTADGDMERFGNVETVNGKTGQAIGPLAVTRGERWKLRFINASTAATHRLKVSGHRFRITHLDGHALAAPYESDTIDIAPGERVDAEFVADGEPGALYSITSDRPDLGISIPVVYGNGSVARVPSPFVPPDLRFLPGAQEKAPDFVLRVATLMGGMMQMGMGGSMGMGNVMGSMGSSAMGMAGWTINGKSFPETEALNVKTGELVKLRIFNDDAVTAGGHRMDHPIHLHGTVFQVLSVDGVAPAQPILKDTIPVPAGGYVDLAFVMTESGQWMFHCHVIDHEDGGMLTVVNAR